MRQTNVIKQSTTESELVFTFVSSSLAPVEGSTGRVALWYWSSTKNWKKKLDQMLIMWKLNAISKQSQSSRDMPMFW